MDCAGSAIPCDEQCKPLGCTSICPVRYCSASGVTACGFLHLSPMIAGSYGQSYKFAVYHATDPMQEPTFGEILTMVQDSGCFGDDYVIDKNRSHEILQGGWKENSTHADTYANVLYDLGRILKVYFHLHCSVDGVSAAENDTRCSVLSKEETMRWNQTGKIPLLVDNLMYVSI